MVELALVLKAIEVVRAVGAAAGQVRSILAARAAGRLSEDAAEEQMDVILAAAAAFDLPAVTPAE